MFDEDKSIKFSGQINIGVSRREFGVGLADEILKLIESEVSNFVASFSSRLVGRASPIIHFLNEYPEALNLHFGESGRNSSGRKEIVLEQTNISDFFNPLPSLFGRQLREEIGIARLLLTSQHGEVELLRLGITEFETKEGSVIAKLSGFWTVSTFVITTIVAAYSTGWGAKQYENWQLDRNIRQKVMGQPCEIGVNWRFSLEQLKELGRQSFDYSAPRISSAEKSARICNVQIALSISVGFPEEIDGKLGPDTSMALEHYAQRRNLPAKINSPLLQAALLDEFRRLFPK